MHLFLWIRCKHIVMEEWTAAEKLKNLHLHPYSKAVEAQQMNRYRRWKSSSCILLWICIGKETKKLTASIHFVPSDWFSTISNLGIEMGWAEQRAFEFFLTNFHLKTKSSVMQKSHPLCGQGSTLQRSSLLLHPQN